MFARGRTLNVVATVIALAVIVASVALAGAEPIGDDAFQRTWERTDKPVADLAVSRTWMWGPEANSPVMTEDYQESPGKQRRVQYFDKSRMEDNSYRESNAPWDVSNGLLVVEMVEGRIQLGDTLFDETPEPAVVNIAGDPDDPTGPTYATAAKLRANPPYADGTVITARVNRNGDITDDPTLATYNAVAAHLVDVPNILHQIASPFWQFMNASGTIYENGQMTTGNLFENPFYATGYPITEAYWANVKVGNVYQDVLMQCFERRCLTYTPGNADGWHVEAGNVGQHYYRWRYSTPSPASPTTTATATASQTPPMSTTTATATVTQTPTSTSTATATQTQPTATSTSTSTPTATPTATATATSTSPTFRTFSDGTHIVGTDIVAGTYRNSDSSGGCYWERQSGLSGDLLDIIANEFTLDRTVVTIAPSDVAFISEHCGTWSSDLSAITASPTAPFGDGMFIVRVDIAPGTWHNSDSSEGCYWARVSDFSGEFGSIISNQFTDTAIQTVTIKGSDRGFQTFGCGTWTKIS